MQFFHDGLMIVLPITNISGFDREFVVTRLLPGSQVRPRGTTRFYTNNTYIT